ncbi:MAG: mycofactocin system GMC family oxidoreductase MftG [Chloroflexi bacterium]|nr:mycofactocin system GMC family oxidoreductase MftG [Chloroflexota bacterium]
MDYDVVIVGGGSAGCALATRVSEDPAISVLLLEAGPDFPEFQQLPDMLKYGWGFINLEARAADSPYNWSFVGTATPQQVTPMPVPRGKVMGGSSAINGQTFIRGAPEDFDTWAEWGNDEWSYLKVLPYFRKMESDEDFRDDFHGTEGPIPVRRHRRETWPPAQEAFYQACVAAGYPEYPDVHNPDSTGLSLRAENNVDGVRMSMALSYLDLARHRLNLTIKPGVTATAIVISDRRAVGLEVASGGERFRVTGSEIVLCSGAVGSPQLLMLSGMGPAGQLQELGIAVIRDLPGVGQNMRDHPNVQVRFQPKAGLSPDPLGKRAVRLRYTAEGSDTPNDMILSPSSLNTIIAEGEDNTHAINCGLYLALGAGELRLTSADPDAHPYMDYKYLQHPRDMERLRESVRLCVRLLRDPAFDGCVERRVSPSDQDLATDDSLDAWLLRNVSTSYHVSGTCKMGPASDPMAVVDQYCRVHGLQGLRVVDASIMPNVVRANTNATTIMIAERVADFIKADFKK